MNIFLDVDETLVHTSVSKKEGVEYMPGAVVMPHDAQLSTIARPCTADLIKFARGLVGHDGVFLLSIGVLEYLLDLNELMGWEFDREHIFAREDLEQHVHIIGTAYNGKHTQVDPILWANPNNVMIDDQPPRYNEIKIAFIGINSTYKTNYLQTPEFYGSQNPTDNDNFFKKTTEFLQERYEASSTK